MTKPQISCDLPGVIRLAEDDVCLRQEQRERGNKLREELIVEIEGLRPGSVSLSPHPHFGFSKNHSQPKRFSDPDDDTAVQPIWKSKRCLNEWGEGLKITSKGLKISASEFLHDSFTSNFTKPLQSMRSRLRSRLAIQAGGL